MQTAPNRTDFLYSVKLLVGSALPSVTICPLAVGRSSHYFTKFLLRIHFADGQREATVVRNLVMVESDRFFHVFIVVDDHVLEIHFSYNFMDSCLPSDSVSIALSNCSNKRMLRPGSIKNVVSFWGSSYSGFGS